MLDGPDAAVEGIDEITMHLSGHLKSPLLDPTRNTKPKSGGDFRL